MSGLVSRVRRSVACGGTVTLLGVLAVAYTPGVASAEDRGSAFTGRDDLRRDEPVAVSELRADDVPLPDPSADQVWDPEAVAAAMPAPGVVGYDLAGGVATAQSVPSTNFPVRLRVPSQHPAFGPATDSAGSAEVELFGSDAAEAAGVHGLLVAVSGAGRGPVDLVADYGEFAGLYGGAWAGRLRWVELPACAVSTPQFDGCLGARPVASDRDLAARTVSTALTLEDAGLSTTADGAPAEPIRVFALAAAAASEGAGDYTATDLSPAGSWAHGGNDGSFTYSYPLRVPPSVGPVPAVTLGYSSASHDGRTSGSNNQASWVGDGWDFDPGYIERSYKPCSLDTDGGNNQDETGDLCWDGDGESVTMSLNGTNATLVRDDATGAWRAGNDSNWRIELLGSPASPGNGTTERWQVTIPDGTRYLFASEVSASGSRLTVPVFGNHSGEPCRASQFADSYCRQAYRWLLDKAIDVHGNMVRFFHSRETGHYGAAGDADNRVSYHRAATLERIEYGLREGAGTPATGRVQFSTSDRCLTSCGSPGDPNTENWPDTPWDLHCDAAPCTSQLSPAFFSTARLTNVTTKVGNGSGGFRNVDTWTLQHEFKDYGDDEQVTLWLKSIRHTGHVGGAVTLPAVQFTGEALPNRVDAAPGVPVMWRWRLFGIKTETGAVITVDYRQPECTPGTLPASPHNNSMRCYPVRWTPEFHHDPIEDWFHKHVVASVVETDTTGGSVAVETTYDYSTSGGGTPVLWAFDDSEFTENEHRTYGQWRGYAQVTTWLGDPAEPRAHTRSRYYRGLDGEPLPSGGTRSVQVTDAEGNTVRDHEALAGRVFEQLSFDGPTVISGETTRFWTRRTATRDRDHTGGSVDAWLTGVERLDTRTRLVGSTWQRSRTVTTFDSRGRPIRVNSLGDVGSAGDEYCERTEYAENTSAWIMNTVVRSETVSVGCGTAPVRPRDAVSDTRTFYDGSETHGASPTKGLPTRVDVLDSWDGGPVYVTTDRSAYDSLGRLVAATNALGHTTTTAYTPAGAGPVIQTVTTNPLGHEESTELEPAWGTPTALVEPNGRRTAIQYDPMGRIAAVWLPGRDPDSTPASKTFEYLVRDDAPTAVVTRTMNHVEEYVTSIVLYDGLLRERQTQQETADRGRLVTETVYDTQGRVDEEFGPNHNLDPPGTSIVRVREEDSSRRVGYLYDGAGRVTDEIFYNRQVERWRTVTRYGGSTDGFQVTVQPPAGAPATATITDARGQTVQKRTWRSNTPTGAFDALTYGYSPTGRLETLTDEAGNVWSWEYDLRGREATSTDPDAGVTTMNYDAAGQLVGATDARGQTVSYDYDPLGRTTARRDGADTLLAQWEYDTAIGGIGMPGRAIRWHDGERYIQENHRVNSLGLVNQRSVTLPESLGPLAGQHWFTQAYYPNGQVGGQGLPDIAGAVERGSLSHYYDHVGNPTRLIFQGRFTGTTVIVDEATYTPFGEIQTRRLGANDARQGFHGFVYEEGTRRLERATFDRQASIQAVADVRYTYDPAGNVLSVADVPEDLPADHELQCYRYDGKQRLIEAWAQGDTSGCATAPSMEVLGGPGPYWNSYAHDVTGNRTGETLRTPGQPTLVRDYQYPAAGQPQPHTLQQVTSNGGLGTGQMSFDYDPAGNTTARQVDAQQQTLQWDAEGRLVQVSQPGTDPVGMIYDADGQRLVRDDGQTVTVFLPDTELTWDRDTGEVAGTRYFTHAGQVIATCTGRDVADWTWLGVDHHGTTTTHAVNAFTGVEQVRRLDPYGNPRGTAPHAWPGQQHFVGGVQDPTGLIHIGARSYDPTTGRFISIDAILAVGDEQQINGYTYARSNPITFTDPTGLCAPHAGSLCPNYDVRNQPAASTGAGSQGGSAQCRLDVPGQGCIWHAGESRPSQVRQGNIDNGSTRLAIDSARRDGGTCEVRTYQIYCLNVQNLYSGYLTHSNDNWLREVCNWLAGGEGDCAIPVPANRAMTVGDVVMFTGSRADWERRLRREENNNEELYDRALRISNDAAVAEEFVSDFGQNVVAHETIHSTQWAAHSSVTSFLVGYSFANLQALAESGNHERNRYEEDANLYWGGYIDQAIIEYHLDRLGAAYRVSRCGCR